MARGGSNMSADTAAFAALLNELRGPLTGVAAVKKSLPSRVVEHMLGLAWWA